MKKLIYILFLTLCSAFCRAQGNYVSSISDDNNSADVDISVSENKRMLEKSREMFEQEKYDSALYYNNKAELVKGKIQDNLELAGDIHEQYCLIFSALNDKQQSDYHRNMYLDIRYQASQDNNLVKESNRLQDESQWLSIKITLLSITFIILIIVFIYFKEKYSKNEKTGEKILKKKDYNLQAEDIEEQIALLQHKLRTNKEQNTDKRAKLFVANTVTPLIARMRKSIETNYLEYAEELLQQIEKYNDLLTEWIKLEQGKLSTKIETFSIGELFDILKRNEKTFALQNITLEVRPSEANVKADKVLTLFMLNTLADNARKAIGSEGKISIYAEQTDNYLELSVKDDGKGMSEEEAANIFTHSITNGHGFGLLNCRGIINSYKKAGSMFNSCMIGVESTLGVGTRFFFRLPVVKAVVAFIFSTVLLTLLPAQTASARPTRYTENITDSILRKAANFADSAYYANLDGNYEHTLFYADSVQLCLLQTYSDPTLMDEITVDVYNEAAIASLALHRWEDYRSYNSVYESVLRRLSNNNEGLRAYCIEQQAFLDNMKNIWRIVNIFALLFIIIIITSVYMMRLRRKKLESYREELSIDEKNALVEQLSYENESLHIANNILTNGLSAIKHETMYYPSRIANLLKTDADKAEISELALFYEQLYTTLSQQLLKQKLSSGVKMKIVTINGDTKIRTDEDLFAYMKLQIKKFLDTKTLDIKTERNGQYTDLIIDAPSLSEADYFSPESSNIPMLISRQIMRDTSENSRGNGILISGKKIIIRFASR